jgi:hypothetical protein
MHVSLIAYQVQSGSELSLGAVFVREAISMMHGVFTHTYRVN